MKCQYCGEEMEYGTIEAKAISGHGLAYPLLSFSKLHRLFKSSINLNTKEQGYFCKHCGIVFVEYHLKKKGE